MNILLMNPLSRRTLNGSVIDCEANISLQSRLSNQAARRSRTSKWTAPDTDIPVDMQTAMNHALPATSAIAVRTYALRSCQGQPVLVSEREIKLTLETSKLVSPNSPALSARYPHLPRAKRNNLHVDDGHDAFKFHWWNYHIDDEPDHGGDAEEADEKPDVHGTAAQADEEPDCGSAQNTYL
jgi:hypothetical protein